jgi:hypothetical protein
MASLLAWRQGLITCIWALQLHQLLSLFCELHCTRLEPQDVSGHEAKWARYVFATFNVHSRINSSWRALASLVVDPILTYRPLDDRVQDRRTR